MTTDLLDRAKALDAAFGRIRVAQAVLPESRDKDALDVTFRSRSAGAPGRLASVTRTAR